MEDCALEHLQRQSERRMVFVDGMEGLGRRVGLSLGVIVVPLLIGVALLIGERDRVSEVVRGRSIVFLAEELESGRRSNILGGEQLVVVPNIGLVGGSRRRTKHPQTRGPSRHR